MILRRFLRDRRASVLPTFAILAVPLIVAMGAVVDYNRSFDQKTVVQDAMDAASLAAGKKLGVLTTDQLKTLASSFYQANIGNKVDNIPTLATAVTSTKVTLTTTLHVPTVFLGLIGLNEFIFNLKSQTTVSTTRLRIALALDNTGSMSSSGKLTALKSATKSLLTQLQGIATVDGDVYVSIVPFVKEVNLGASNRTSAWDDWLDWNTLTQDTSDYSVPSSSVGPGSACPWSHSSGHGTSYDCVTQPGGSSNTSTVPSSGTYKGYICPEDAALDGCYTSTAVTSTTTQTVGTGRYASCSGYSNCTCTGTGNGKVCTATITTTTYDHAWTVDKTKWGGCVSDRGSSAPGTASGPDQKYYASTNSTYADNTPFAVEQYSACPQAMKGLTYDWTALNTLVDNMVANGSTNQPIGLVWGWQSLVGGGPFTVPAMDSSFKYQQIIILLSDGLNTQDRWYGNGSDTSTSVDNRMYYKSGSTVSGTCANVKASGVIIYAVQVNTGGDPTSTLLQNCASDSSKFYELKTSDAIITTFNAIGNEISQLRIEL